MKFLKISLYVFSVTVAIFFFFSEKKGKEEGKKENGRTIDRIFLLPFRQFNSSMSNMYCLL